MTFTILTIAATLGIAVALFHWRAGVRRRNAQSWESLVQRLEPGWDHRAVRAYSLWQEGQNASPEEKWKRIEGAKGLWAMYENARVMQEMADYAARNGAQIDAELLAALRRDALQIRFCVVSTLVQYAFTQVNESICAHAFRATSAYTEMADRTRQLLQVNNGAMAASFAGAGV
jgi:Flp pilus assembly protein TadB